MTFATLTTIIFNYLLSIYKLEIIKSQTSLGKSNL